MNSTRLPTPGCIPEAGEISFVAPTGNPAAALQDDSATWGVLWSDPEAAERFEYGPGPGGADWADVTLDGEIVWMDDAGERWLTRHLVLEERAPLSDAALDIARRDYLAADALEAAERTCTALDQCAEMAPATGDGKAGPVAELAALAHRVRELAALQARQLKAAWAVALAAEPEPVAPEDDILQGCECDNTHEAQDTVCRWCYGHGRRRWADPDVPEDAGPINAGAD
jgi:hypothetical protein